MKIAIAALHDSLDSLTAPRFGRAPWLIIYNSAMKEYASVDNAGNMNAIEGSGVLTADQLRNAGIDAVVSEHVGPMTFQFLSEAGIKVYYCTTGRIKDIIGKFSRGILMKGTSANCDSH